MFVLFGTIAVLILTIVQLLAFNHKKSWGDCIHTFLKNEFIVNLVSLEILTRIFKYQHIFETSGYEMSSFLKFFLLAFLVGIVFIVISETINGTVYFEKNLTKQSKGAIAIKTISSIFVFFGCALYTAANWSTTAFGKQPADAFFITLFSPTEGTERSVYVAGFEGPVFKTVLVTAIFALIAFSNITVFIKNKDKAKAVFNDVAKRILCLLLSLCILASGAYYFIDELSMKDVFYSYVLKSDLIEDVYVDPRDANITFPEQKRNIIHIFLESMENSYLSKDLGGNMDKNLMPELTEMSYDGFVFSNNDTKFGGPLQATGTQWSIASIVNQTSGLPMKTPDKPNYYGTKDNFFPGAYTLFDILNDNGYEQTTMIGSSAWFGGLVYYYETHGVSKIVDRNYAKQNGMIPSDYNVWWGFEDDKLYEFAKDELTRLYETGKPFHFEMETADTHRPHGYLSPNAPTPYDDQYSNVIAYSTSETVKFINWIKQQPFYENTTIVLVGDHLSMDTDFFENFDDSYLRTQYNLILNPAPELLNSNPSIFVNRQYANFDFLPTILTSMGVKYDGNRLGIGTDLFSGEKTIIEEYGLDHTNRELMKKSEFFNETILHNKEFAKTPIE